MSRSLFMIAALSAALSSSVPAQRPREKLGSAPPPVVAQRASVKRGEKVTVALSIHGTRGEALQFLIRTLPRHGSLSRVESRGASQAVVTYSPFLKDRATEDRFFYAVRSSEGVSAPGLVSITISDPVVVPAKLVAPASLEFPDVISGQRATAELEFANRGGSIAEGSVTVPAPWSVDGQADYRVESGERHILKIAFNPRKPGTYDGEAVLSGPPRTSVALRGVAGERIIAKPTSLELNARPGNQTRMGVLHLSNRSSEAVAVSLSAGPRLLMDGTISVPALGEIDVPVFADASEASAFEDELKLSAEDWSGAVKIRVAAMKLPPQPATPSSPETGRAGISPVRNDAAEPGIAVATLQVATGNPAESPAVRPDETPGKQSAESKENGSEEAKPSDEPRATPGESAPSEKPPSPDLFALLPKGREEFPNGMGNFVKETGPKSVVLEWPAGLTAGGNVRFEERELYFGANGALQTKWVGRPAAQVEASGELVRAELRGLAPETLHMIRVVTGSGDESKTRFTVEFWSPVKQPFFQFGWRLPILLVTGLLLGVLAWRRWKARQPAGW